MGDTILGNRYEIIRKIGDGGMAFVYEAKDRLLNRTVALKVLRPEFVDDDEFLTKFKREAEAVASLSHPNIVNVYDVGEDGKVHYIVMEFVDGKNLKEIIQDEGILDEYTALDITKQIAMALSAAHKKGIIHRDIKPHNILISNEGRVVKVADFGIAKAVSNSTMTNIGSIIGSVHYFSPEQAKGKFVTNNADLYSLGIVLYEMLIGKVPFRGDSPISIALQHINDDIDFTSEEKVRIPQSVRTTIKKLTEKSSADRYQTAEELIEDIEYIEKNIDLDFIKEYDDFATKKIDEKEINKVVNPTLAKPAPEKVVKPVEVADLDDDEDYYDDFYEEDEDEEEEEIMRAKKNQRPKSTPSKRTKKKKKKQESPKSRRRLKVIAAVLILILCAQVFLAYKFLFAGGFGNKSLTVPNLVNMTLEEAQSAVEKEGLYLSVKSEEYNSEVDENCIISQTPEGGSTNVKKGDTINVVVSKGSSQASVPNVVGLTLSNAKQLIEENNLKVGTVKYEYSSIYKEGTVLSQSPGAGSSRAQEGDEVNLYVSKGSEKSNTQTPTVPDKKPTTPENNTPTEPGSNSGNSGGNSGGSNSGNSGGNSGNNGSNSGGSNSGNSGGNSGDNGGSSGGSNSGDNGGSSGGSNSGDNGDSSGGSNSGDNGGTSSGTGANIGKTE
ncbi:Putative serine/threonine-protein kinase and phosphatase [Clostridioides difficile]|uniref:non-specific serine/threonine protein kinase n=1 Tax=Clostridioides difficile TaxID=1496 RepID=A0A069AGT1_CLODI|nr:Stk1 family PASTA domain-containing Ser/Thr kinase [Clostridioides difficile]CDS85153.1 Putative serine/threonine-protein kinase and phosphatase [Clostridioides difficile]CDS88484.1 putative Non-specific serine/threonine protein kinase [Clostridioides difficile]CDT64970.1 Putative serine/threonine-protein kinase and phosphatase [Clostridioides difficile]HBH3720673.1 Stk1 family PASTA domain-containing Ser/Thr kinase [Clostridioides difficile]HBH3740037.1 Stk1 family PASTA domain-containing 